MKKKFCVFQFVYIQFHLEFKFCFIEMKGKLYEMSIKSTYYLNYIYMFNLLKYI